MSDTKIAILETQMKRIEKQLDNIEKKLDEMCKSFVEKSDYEKDQNRIDKKIAGINTMLYGIGSGIIMWVLYRVLEGSLF